MLSAQTQEYDRLAIRSLLYPLVPLMVGLTVYSLVYQSAWLTCNSWLFVCLVQL